MIFGVDVGGTTVKIGLVQNNKIIDKYEIITNSKHLIQDICLSIKDYALKHAIEITGIGFGLPGVVRDNYIYNLPNIGIQNIDLVKEVHQYLPHIQVQGGNDANVAALGEMLYHHEYQSACMLTLGTGVGCGIVLNGKILEGCHGSAGEVGHMVIADEYQFHCNCGLDGCLETVASATGVVRLANYYRDSYATQLPMIFSAKDVFDFAKKNDSLCSFVVDQLCYYIAKCISILSITVDVDVYYIGGGVSRAGDILINGIRKHYQKLSFLTVKNVSIEIATLLNDAGILGSAGLVSED